MRYCTANFRPTTVSTAKGQPSSKDCIGDTMMPERVASLLHCHPNVIIACGTSNHFFLPVYSVLFRHLPYVIKSKARTHTISMSQELMAQSNTVEAQLTVHRALKNTANALKETRMDEPFPAGILSRLQRSLDFVFKHREAHRHRERQRYLQQRLAFADLIVCCMSFGLTSMLITEFDFMIAYAGGFVRDQVLKRRLYHPEIERQLTDSGYDIEHKGSHEQLLKG